MKSFANIKIMIPLLAASLMLVNAKAAPSQYSRMTPDQIMRQAQAQQEAIQKIGDDLTKGLNEIADNYRQRKDDERRAQEQRDADNEERRSRRSNDDNQSGSDNQ
jgi:hypothetical protein